MRLTSWPRRRRRDAGQSVRDSSTHASRVLSRWVVVIRAPVSLDTSVGVLRGRRTARRRGLAHAGSLWKAELRCVLHEWEERRHSYSDGSRRRGGGTTRASRGEAFHWGPIFCMWQFRARGWKQPLGGAVWLMADGTRWGRRACERRRGRVMRLPVELATRAWHHPDAPFPGSRER